MALVTLILDEESRNSLNDFLVDNSLKPKGEFHSTLVYTEETPIFIRQHLIDPLRTYLPIKLSSGTYQFDVFDSSLVLRYEHLSVRKMQLSVISESVRHSIHAYDDLSEEELDILRASVKEKRVSQIFYDFNPHITLAKSFQGDHRNIQPPRMQLTFDRIYWKVLKKMKSSPEEIFRPDN
ncbi:MAG: hypothetical protein AABX03_04700 [Nanoarchaeota archaeon]